MDERDWVSGAKGLFEMLFRIVSLCQTTHFVQTSNQMSIRNINWEHRPF